jgi:hypothetical protein
MSQTINIPIRFQFFRTPCVWEIRTVTRRFAVGVRSESVRMLFPKRMLPGREPQLLDGWERRDEFFRLPQTENALLGFLTEVGVWTAKRDYTEDWSKEVKRHIQEGHPLPIPVNGLWAWRETLRKVMVNKKGFTEDLAPPPRTLLEAQMRLSASPSNQFTMCLDLSSHSEGVITVTNAHHMLLTTVYVDIVRGLGFKYCRRSDCKALVPITNNHEKFYCSQPCAHLDNVRKKRREAREATRSATHKR